MRREASEASSGREGTNQLLNYISMLVALTVCMRFCLFSSVCGRAMPFARARDEDVHQEEGQEKIQSHSRDYPNHLTVKHMPTALCLGVLMRASCQFATKFMQTQTAQSVIPSINSPTGQKIHIRNSCAFMASDALQFPRFCQGTASRSKTRGLRSPCVSLNVDTEVLIKVEKPWYIAKRVWLEHDSCTQFSGITNLSNQLETFCCDNGFVSKILSHRCIISKPPPKQSHAEAKKRNQRCTCRRVLWTPR